MRRPPVPARGDGVGEGCHAQFVGRLCRVRRIGEGVHFLGNCAQIKVLVLRQHSRYLGNYLGTTTYRLSSIYEYLFNAYLLIDSEDLYQSAVATSGIK